jgi:hypothetical protein
MLDTSVSADREGAFAAATRLTCLFAESTQEPTRNTGDAPTREHVNARRTPLHLTALIPLYLDARAVTVHDRE